MKCLQGGRARSLAACGTALLLSTGAGTECRKGERHGLRAPRAARGKRRRRAGVGVRALGLGKQTQRSSKIGYEVSAGCCSRATAAARWSWCACGSPRASGRVAWGATQRCGKKKRIETVGDCSARQKKWPLNEGRIPNSRGVRVRVSTGLQSCRGKSVSVAKRTS
jgi:hypothetical protein